MYIAIGLGILLFIIIISYFVSNHNKFKFAIIEIDEAENNIEVLLQKKIDLINRTIPIIKKELKLDSFLDDMNFLNNSTINHFEMYNHLCLINNQLMETLDENEKLFKSVQLVNILDEIKDTDEDIDGSIKFYNDSVTEFNKLIVSFPSNIIATISRYKRKEFYNNETREMFDIINDK